LYQPLVRLPSLWAAFVSLAINTAASVLTLVLVSRVLVERLVGRVDPVLIARVALLGAFLTLDKIKGELFQVETNVFMLLAFTAALYWVDTHPRLCGLALGFAFNIKYWPLVLLPYLLLRRRWRAVGWFSVWAIVFAILPAISMGWSANLRAWEQAGGGLFKLFGLDLHVPDVAHVRLITDPVSVSLTSGLARITGLPPIWTLVLAAAIGALFCIYAAVVYVRNGVPLLAWPSVKKQGFPPYRGLLTIEWMGLLLLTLIFSPFTNSRHLYMLLDVNVAAAVLLLGSRVPVPRKLLWIATILMGLGITFPPGGTAFFERADSLWRFIGGGAWCMLGMYIVLIWTNVRCQRAAAGRTRPMAAELVLEAVG